MNTKHSTIALNPLYPQAIRFSVRVDLSPRFMAGQAIFEQKCRQINVLFYRYTQHYHAGLQIFDSSGVMFTTEH